MMIIADKPGQIGNRLFIFGHLIGFASANNIPFVYPAFDEYAKYFKFTKHNLFCGFPIKNNLHILWNHQLRGCIYKLFLLVARIMLKTKKMTGWTPFGDVIEIGTATEFDLSNSGFIEKARCGTIFLLGWLFRDRMNFIKNSATIRHLFTPCEPYLQNVVTLSAKARNNADVLVGIHIRHGDYKQFLDGKYFYSFNVYRDVMTKMKSLLAPRRVSFLLCSNVPVSKNVFQDLAISLGSGHFIEDLYAFSRCDLLVGPPSTFTMWASFYGKVPLFQIENAEVPINLDMFKVVEC